MSDHQQLRWQEPYIFSLRMRDRRGWLLKGWLIVGIFVVMMIGWYLDQHYGKGLRIGLTGAILLNTGIAVFLGFLSDLGFTEVQATGEGVARGFYGPHIGASLWRYPDILTFSFIPRESSGRPFGLLMLVTRQGIVVLGVPTRVSTSELVEFFRRHGVQETPAPKKVPLRNDNKT